MEEKKKKGIKLFPLVIIACILFILMILSYVYLMKADVNESHQEVINIAKEENEIAEEEHLDDPYYDSEISGGGDYEVFYEEDYGNKVDADKKYIYVKASIDNTYDTQEPDAYKQLQWLVINIDSEEVEKLNKEFEDYYNKYSPYCLKGRYEKNPELHPNMDYYYTASNGILSLVVYYGNEDDGAYNAKRYNIDIKKGTILSNEELLKSVGISGKDFERYLDNSLKIHYLSYIATERDFEGKYPNYESFLNGIEFTNLESKNLNFKNDTQLIIDNCDLSYNVFSDDKDSIYIDIIELWVPNPYSESEKIYDYSPSFQVLAADTYTFSNQYYFWVTDLFDGSRNYVGISAPTINIDSEDAKKVSNELLSFYNNAKDAIVKNGGDLYITSVETDNEMQMPDGSYVKTKDEIVVNKDKEQVIDDYYTIDYRYSVIDDKILHVIVEETNGKYSNLDHGLWEYKSYNFDIETGKLLTNKEFVEKCGLNSEEVAKKIKDGRNIEDVTITVYDYQEFSEGGAYEKEKISSVKEFYIVPQEFFDPWIKVNK